MTPKQQRFVDEYLVDLNATQAAIRTGYSVKTAYSSGQRLLSNVEIGAAIAARQAKLAQKLEVTQERIVAELARIGFSDIRRMFTEGGEAGAGIKRIEDLDDDTAAALSSVEVTTRRVPGAWDEYEDVVKIKLWDKKGALVDLGKHLGMFKEQLDVSLAGNITFRRVNCASGE